MSVRGVLLDRNLLEKGYCIHTGTYDFLVCVVIIFSRTRVFECACTRFLCCFHVWFFFDSAPLSSSLVTVLGRRDPTTTHTA